MLTGRLIHPPLLHALAKAGHGSTVLIADGNYPFATATGKNTTTVWLNLSAGLLSVDQVLDALIETIPIESAVTMLDPDGNTAPPHEGYQRALPGLEIGTADRYRFYDLARDESLAVLIATGDERICANLLLTVGVR